MAAAGNAAAADEYLAAARGNRARQSHVRGYFPLPVPREKVRVRVIWRTKCAGVASIWRLKSPEHLVLGITLTPALSRSTGRGRMAAARDICDRPGQTSPR